MGFFQDWTSISTVLGFSKDSLGQRSLMTTMRSRITFVSSSDDTRRTPQDSQPSVLIS